MKFKKILLIALCTLSLSALVACESSEDIKTYTLEAEYINLDGIQGSGYSSEASGVDMIYGNGTDNEKRLGWSNGYYVSSLYKNDLQLDFKFTSDKSTTATIIVRVGSEIGDVIFDFESFEVQLNGDVMIYSSFSLENSEAATMKFVDKVITSNAILKEGENTISLVVRPNDLFGIKPGAPCIDCIKLKSDSNISWNPKTDNPDRRGAIL